MPTDTYLSLDTNVTRDGVLLKHDEDLEERRRTGYGLSVADAVRRGTGSRIFVYAASTTHAQTA